MWCVRFRRFRCRVSNLARGAGPFRAADTRSTIQRVTARREAPLVSVPSQTLRARADTARTLRGRKRWSLATLAERSHVSRGMLRQIEAARTNPSIGTLIQVANAFGVGV